MVNKLVIVCAVIGGAIVIVIFVALGMTPLPGVDGLTSDERTTLRMMERVCETMSIDPESDADCWKQVEETRQKALNN